MQSLIVTLATWFAYAVVFAPFAMIIASLLFKKREHRVVNAGVCVIAAPLFALGAAQSLHAGNLSHGFHLFCVAALCSNVIATVVHAIVLSKHRLPRAD